MQLEAAAERIATYFGFPLVTLDIGGSQFARRLAAGLQEE